jgi:hypothetical protein
MPLSAWALLTMSAMACTDWNTRELGMNGMTCREVYLQDLAVQRDCDYTNRFRETPLRSMCCATCREAELPKAELPPCVCKAVWECSGLGWRSGCDTCGNNDGKWCETTDNGAGNCREDHWTDGDTTGVMWCGESTDVGPGPTSGCLVAFSTTVSAATVTEKTGVPSFPQKHFRSHNDMFRFHPNADMQVNDSFKIPCPKVCECHDNGCSKIVGGEMFGNDKSKTKKYRTSAHECMKMVGGLGAGSDGKSKVVYAGFDYDTGLCAVHATVKQCQTCKNVIKCDDIDDWSCIERECEPSRCEGYSLEIDGVKETPVGGAWTLVDSCEETPDLSITVTCEEGTSVFGKLSVDDSKICVAEAGASAAASTTASTTASAAAAVFRKNVLVVIGATLGICSW